MPKIIWWGQEGETLGHQESNDAVVHVVTGDADNYSVDTIFLEKIFILIFQRQGHWDVLMRMVTRGPCNNCWRRPGGAVSSCNRWI